MVSSAQPDLTWNLVTDIRQVFEFPFMVNAFRAGTIVAVLCALVGWFMVLRRQSFAGHTLAVVGFPGAAGAVLLGVSATYGYFVFGIAAALVIGLVTRTSGRGYSEESAVTGTVQASPSAPGSSSSASTAASSVASTPCCSAAFSGSRRARCSCSWWSPSSAIAVLAVGREAAALRFARPGGRRGARGPDALALHRLPRPPRGRRGGGRADHRRAAGVRPARGAAGCRADADPASGPQHRDRGAGRAARRVGVALRRVLLALSDRVLPDVGRVRRLPVCPWLARASGRWQAHRGVPA